MGTRLGPYEVVAHLGAGGMGEVWRATDSKLRREVALKVLPEAFAADPDRLARFEREAQVLAQLQHPCIASVYGLEESNGVRALVMELVPGEDLAERLRRGPLPIDEALAVARQIADALEEAHEKGIVHRDLKPANVKVTPDGKVKVLDFGLARALEPAAGSSPDLTSSPTLTGRATQMGVVLGTAAYMAPEQARGKAVDRRADIWAFGAVLYELLSGQRALKGDEVPDVLAAVLRQEIDWTALPAGTPSGVRLLLERCLDRDARRRLRDIGEARVALDAIALGGTGAAPAPAISPAPRRGISPSVVALALLGAAAIAAVAATRWATPAFEPEEEVTEFSIPVRGLVSLSLSPDGRRLGWVSRTNTDAPSSPWDEVGGTGDATRSLWVRDLEHRMPREIVRDTDLRRAFWSPDGSQVAVQIGEKLWRVPVAGGERTPICDLPAIKDVAGRTVLDAVWRRDDTLLFAAWRGGIYRVAAQGGEPVLHVPIDPAVDVDFHRIVLLPDGESLLLQVHRQQGESDVRLPSGRLELFRDGRRQPLAGAEGLGEVDPVGVSRGMLLVARAESAETPLWGLPFDARRGVITGPKSILIPRVDRAAVGADGTLAWVAAGERPSVVVRVDRTGAEVARLGEPHPHLDRQALSPDGTRLAVVLNLDELWVRDLRRGTLTRLAKEEGEFVEDPQWSPDGRTLYYTVGFTSRFRSVRADPGATPETLLDDAYRAFLSPDGGGILLFKASFRLADDSGLYWEPFDAQGRRGPRRRIRRGFDTLGRLAPGGRLLAFSELTNGRREAFLTTFPAADQTIQLSAGGGGTPQWSADGRTVYYLAGRALIEVGVGLDASGRPTATPERRLFDLGASGLKPAGWQTAPDGSGFLFLKSLATDAREEIVVASHGLRRTKGPAR